MKKCCFCQATFKPHKKAKWFKTRQMCLECRKLAKAEGLRTLKLKYGNPIRHTIKL